MSKNEKTDYCYWEPAPQPEDMDYWYKTGCSEHEYTLSNWPESGARSVCPECKRSIRVPLTKAEAEELREVLSEALGEQNNE